jgi:hypothetical protein
MKRFAFGALAGLLLFACVTSPSGAQKAPDWIAGAPRPDAKYTYFTAEATDAAGDRAKAADAAVSNIIATVVKYLGVKVQAEFEGEVQATLDSYKTAMKQNVTLSGDARFAGFAVAETFYAPSKEKKSKAVTAFVLAKYETAEMEKERKRLQALIDEQNNLVLVPESAGTAAMAAGRATEAVQYFLQAASGAASLEIDNKDVKVRRNLDKALNAVLPLRIVRSSSPAKVALGKEPDEPFTAMVVYGEGDSAPGVAGAKVTGTYQRKQGSGRLVGKSEALASDESGLVKLSPPAFEFTGASKVSFSLDTGVMREYLDALPEAYEAQADAITRELAAKGAEIVFTIGSEASALPLHIAIADIDEAGAFKGSSAQRAAVDEFTKQKFKALAMPASADDLKAGDDAALLQAGKAASAARIVYGTATVTGVKKDGGAFVGTCKIVLSAVDAATGAILATSERAVNAIGTTEAEARQAAWKAAGTAAVKDLLSRL